MLIDILCRVVDNLGDIGFVYRLARALSERPERPRLRLVVDDLSAFAGICPGVDPGKDAQNVGDWSVTRWFDPGESALRGYFAEPPRLVLECYACGRPDWFERILFDEGDPVPRHIVNLEYLTAEPWARDFHLLPSLTRSPLVRKTVFMPGFERGTGGLLLDSAFETLLDRRATSEGSLSIRRSVIADLGLAGSTGIEAPRVTPVGSIDAPEEAFWVLVFSYEHDFSSIVGDLARFHAVRPILALVAAGRSAEPFLEAWRGAGQPFPVLALPLVAQPLWDAILAAADFTVIRGEESFARACLSGRPFLWQCYPFAENAESVESSETSGNLSGALARDAQTIAVNQGGGGQLPKVRAFLDLVKPYLPEEGFSAYERLTLSFNGAVTPGDAAGAAGCQTPAASAQSASAPFEPAPGDLLSVLRGLESLSGFGVWARDVRNIGNLAANLMTFLRDLG